MKKKNKNSYADWTALFADIPKKDRYLLAKNATVIELPAGARLCRQGEVPREVFLLLGGVVRVVKRDKEVTTVGPGNLLGEMSVRQQKPFRNADVVADSDITVAAMSLREFNTLCHGSEAFASWTEESIAKRSS